MSNPWGGGGGGIGAWAAEAEREEEEQRAAAVDSKSFPSLKESASAKPKKKKMTLSEFYSASSGAKERLTPDEIVQLPTGPKQRSPDESHYGNRLGGGFSSYNRSSGPQNRPHVGGFDEERRPRRVPEFDQPSRADETDDWSKAKKSLPSFDQGRQNRYVGSGGGGGGGGGFSRADEANNWIDLKRSSTFGSGFRSSGTEADRWSSRGGGSDGRGGGLSMERMRLVLDPPKVNNNNNNNNSSDNNSNSSEEKEVNNTTKANPFGAARPREEVLAEKGLDWKKIDSEIDAKKASVQTSSRPSSSQSARSEGVENVVKPRLKVNPFGDAKPREVLLEERGQDWRKIDLELEHRRVDRPETEEEKMLKEAIDHLKKELEKESTVSVNKESLDESNEDQPSLHDILRQKERDLEMLTRDLDDKVRFGQKASERPGSGVSNVGSFSERSHSGAGSFDESRSVESMDRPRSRGTADVWTRQGEDRRNFERGKQQGFLDNRNSDRSRTGDRW